MPAKPAAAFLDFATLGPGIDTSRLEWLLELRYFDYTSRDEVDERLRGAKVALVNKAKIDRASIEAADALELIVLAATGSDNVDTAAAKEAGIGVANVRDYCSDAVAQHVFALILGLTQGIGIYAANVRAGAWVKSKSFALFDHPIRELSGLKLGLIGYGSLGQAVARAGECFGMQIMISMRPGTSGPPPEGRVELERVLTEADVLSLHCPLNDATRHLIDADALRRMKNDAIVINTARGGLIDSEALAEALRSGQIAGAGIDVLPVEPPPADDPLLA
ncbi:MAG: NAD(P)-dependent oxidoreductase, partial [Gammaproteobacteria bacterium]|nr:NAD(P)-dependent oxidoreductase [Gammaproteobacteria bacterium]